MTDVVAKVIGADFELSNVLLSANAADGRAAEAASRLLDEIPGYPDEASRYGSTIEFRRRFLSGAGGSAYIDTDHLEINTCEHLRASDHAGHVHAGLRLAREAQRAAQRRLPPHVWLHVLANNSDGHTSWGSHFNVLTTRRCFRDVFQRKPHLAGLLATHLVTSVVYGGQGMVGAANGRPPCDFQLSQRADWFQELISLDTMQARGVLNTRDEPHAAADRLARFHIIYFDMVLSPVANWLKAGTTQLVVAMCEANFVDPALLLNDPLGVASPISRDLSLKQRWPMAGRGRSMTAVDIQEGLANLAGELVASGRLGDAVPDAQDCVAMWLETLQWLRRRDVEALARRCDNWLKYMLLERFRSRKGLTWQSAEVKALDLRFSSLDPADGLFFPMATTGVAERMPSDAEINRLISEPPDETRAYLRAHILRRWGQHVRNMDWGWIEFRVPSQRRWCATARLDMPDPRRFGRRECAAALEQCQTLEDLLEAFSSDANEPNTRHPPALKNAESDGTSYDAHGSRAPVPSSKADSLVPFMPPSSAKEI